LYPGVVRAAVAITAGLAAVACGMVAIAGPPGRVVRVERGHGGTHRTPRICQVMSDRIGECWGVAPRIGETATLLDQNGHLGDIRVVEVEEKAAGRCRGTKDWRFHFVRLSPDPGRSPNDQVALFDVDLTPSRARTIVKSGQVPRPDTREGVQVWKAVDLDGDGAADLAGTAYQCDAHGDPAGRRIRQIQFICIDYWTGRGDSWRLVRHDQFAACVP